MSKQSSIEWLIQQFNGNTSRIANMMGVKKYNSIIEKAKAMHKEEIEDTFECGYSSGYRDNGKDGKQYYNETFGDEKEML